MFCFLLDRTFQGYVIICYKQITVHSCSFHLFFGFVWLCFTWRQQSWQRRILCLCVYMYLCVCFIYIHTHIYISPVIYSSLPLSSNPEFTWSQPSALSNSQSPAIPALFLVHPTGSCEWGQTEVSLK